MNKEKQILENQISLNLREDKTLEIYVGDSLAAEISDGRLDMEFVKEILEGLDYEINESSFTIRPLHSDEQKYTYRQSTQIEGQTGSIGYLRGDFGSGKEFFSSWFDHRRDLKTDKFKSELDEVINALRSEEYGLLKSRTDMTQYAAKYPDSAFQGNYATEYGFRADTEKYSFLMAYCFIFDVLQSFLFSDFSHQQSWKNNFSFDRSWNIWNHSSCYGVVPVCILR